MKPAVDRSSCRHRVACAIIAGLLLVTSVLLETVHAENDNQSKNVENVTESVKPFKDTGNQSMNLTTVMLPSNNSSSGSNSGSATTASPNSSSSASSSVYQAPYATTTPTPAVAIGQSTNPTTKSPQLPPTTKPPVVQYGVQYRIVNKDFVAALGNKSTDSYKTMSSLTDTCLRTSLVKIKIVVADLIDTTFSAGSVVVVTVFTTSTVVPLTDFNSNSTSFALTQTFLQLNYTIDGINFKISTTTPGPSSSIFDNSTTPGPSSSIFDNSLMIGLVAGLIAVVGSCVIVLMVVVCKRQHHARRMRSLTSVKTPVVSSESSVSEYDPTRGLGLPRQQSLFWKGNRTAMNEPGEFDEHFTYWRSDPNIGGREKPPARGGRSATQPNSRQKHHEPVPEQHSETESSDWRFMALDAEPGSRPLTDWLQRAVHNAASQTPEMAVSPLSRGSRRRRRADHQTAAIMDDVDDDRISSDGFEWMAYPAQAPRQAARQQPIVRAAIPPPVKPRNWSVDPQSGEIAIRPSAGIIQRERQDNVGVNGYRPRPRPIASGLPRRKLQDSSAQRDYVLY